MKKKPEHFVTRWKPFLSLLSSDLNSMMHAIDLSTDVDTHSVQEMSGYASVLRCTTAGRSACPGYDHTLSHLSSK